MKKFRIVFVTVLTVLLFIVTPTQAQVFLLEDDFGVNLREATAVESNTVPIPYQSTDLDEWEYTPLGSGWLILAGLGGLYLMKKRKGKEND